MRYLAQLGVITIIFAFTDALSCAAQSLVIQANPDNRPVTVALTPEQAAANEIIFYFESRGNMSVPVYAAMNGPAGLRANLEALPMKRMQAEQALSVATGWKNLETDRALVIRTSSRTQYRTSAQYGFDCNNLDPAVRAQLELLLSFVLGRNPTQQEICTYLNGATWGPGGGSGYNPINSGGDTETPIPPPPGSSPDFISGEGDGYVQGRAVLHKDTCGTKPGDRHLVRARVSLSGVDPALRQSGFEVTFTFSSKNYRGSTAASIKPESDGQFAPRPLLLMSALGGYGDSFDTVYQWRWKKNKGRLTARKRAEDYVYYRGFVLARIVADGMLTGGRTTFELTNGYSIYSVCMRAVRARQRVNGYPG